ncbi:MAG: hypothetical protein ACJAQ3_002782 [Planctomycetota bacterium]|jgi:hypothetical protein
MTYGHKQAAAPLRNSPSNRARHAQQPLGCWGNAVSGSWGPATRIQLFSGTLLVLEDAEVPFDFFAAIHIPGTCVAERLLQRGDRARRVLAEMLALRQHLRHREP